MLPRNAPHELYGRSAERARLDELVEAARLGHSGVLVLEGEPGIGKSALLTHVADTATGCRVLHVTGIESEMELAFAGLHQLCRPMLDELDRLPAPQSTALGTALGLLAGNPPDRFLVGLAALSLIAEGARDRPLICLVDDAQWLDRASAQAFAFVARRLEAESVVFVIAARTADDDQTWAGLPRLAVSGLARPHAQALLERTVPGRLDRRVVARMLAETKGNPLALLMLPRWFSAAELALGPQPEARSILPSSMEEGIRRELRPLPPETRLLLLLAAADPVGNAVLLWEAADHLGLDRSAATPARDAGLIELGDAVLFRHPLVRTVVYQHAGTQERRAVHGALAEVTDPHRDPDRRAWHRARAASGHDEAIAVELEHSAERALAQGGFAAAAAFLENAARLTPDVTARTRRQLACVQNLLHAGAFEPALEMLARTEAQQLSDLQRARAAMLRARIVFASRRGNEAVPLLVDAARQLEPLDLELALDGYVDALTAAVFASSLAKGVGAVEVSRAARRAPMLSPPRRGDVLLKAVASLHIDGYEASAPLLQDAILAFDDDAIPRDDGVRLAFLAAAVASGLWDERAWDGITKRHLEIVRDAGALSALPLALNTRVIVELFAGDLPTASRLVCETEAVSEAVDAALLPYGAIGLAAFRGDEGRARSLIERARANAVARGEGVGISFTRWAEALLFNGLGRYRQALEASREVARDPEEIALGVWGLAELIEAAVREGEDDTAAAAFEQISVMARASGTDWASGVAARAEAQLRDGSQAEDLYQEAIDRLGRTNVPTELARARLLYGEWLRRTGRRLEARAELRAAHESFATMGMDGFAERARRELGNVGEMLRKRTRGDTASQELTAQEMRIARLAAAGLTNPDIGAELFLSPRTVEWHMRKVFAKLDITSRRQLRDVSGSALTSA